MAAHGGHLEKAMKRVLVYSHDTFGLGNIRRMLAISQHLAASDSDLSILIVSGSPMLHAFRIPPRVDYLKLPCLARNLSGDYGVKFLELPYQDTIRLRANLLTSAILDFDPNLIVTDKKPLGVGNELAPALEMVQRRGRRTRAVLLLRDILDAPEATHAVWTKNGYFDAIERFYDQVLVVGSRNVFDLAKEYRFPASAYDKVRYCGYLRRERGRNVHAHRERFAPSGERLVLVTAGGGEDGNRLVSTYLDALDAGCALDGVRSVVVCGPEMSSAQRAAATGRAVRRSDVSVIDFCDDMMGLMEACDLTVAMGGYNTVCELLTLRKRAILVPRVKPVQEQWIRAQRLARLGLVRTIHPDQLAADGLARTVCEELERVNVKPRALYQLDLDGLERVRNHIQSLLSHCRASASLEPFQPMVARR